MTGERVDAVDPADPVDPVDGDGDGVDAPVGGDVSPLERRYRRLLRVLLPRRYREGREEEMVEVFLAGRPDGLDREHGWPGWGEAAATAGLAVRVRLAAGRGAGSAVRLLGLAGLVAQLVLSAQAWTSAARWGEPAPVWWAELPVAVAFACLVAGRRAVGRVAAGVSAVVAVPLGDASWWAAVFVVPAWVVAALVVAGFHVEAPPVPRRWWAVAGAGVAAGALCAWAVGLSPVSVLSAWVVTALVVA
ncbi:hypothetical protein ACR807_41390, partial [Saccharothrix sp. Mg75]